MKYSLMLQFFDTVGCVIVEVVNFLRLAGFLLPLRLVDVWCKEQILKHK